MIETNQEKEARVFAKFAEVAGFLERGAEFELKDPPHPDILMTGLPEGDIAFELVELVSESVAKIGPTLESISEELHQQFDEIDSTIKNQIYEKFADAVIFVRFSRKVNKNKRLQIYPKLF